MKKVTLSILLILFAFVVNAQAQCHFTHYTSPGTTMVTFTPDSNYSPNQYYFFWTFGDGDTATAINPVHSYMLPTGYIPCCYIYDIVTDSLICQSCDSIYFNFFPNCNISVTQSNNNFVMAQCVAANGTYNTWDFGDGSQNQNGNYVTHTYAGPGIYNLCNTVRDTGGLVHCTPCQQIVVLSSGNCSYSVTQNSAYNYTFSTNAPFATSVVWFFGDGTVDSNSTSVTHTYNSQGPFVVCMNLVDSGIPCQHCDTLNPGTAQGSCIFSTATSSNPNTFTFYPQINISNFTNISWDFGDGNTFVDTFSTPILQTPATHTYSTSGAYTVCMKVSDSTGIICTSCDLVQVNSTANCNFFYTVGANNLQYGFAVNLSGGSNYTVTWDFGDGTTGTGDTLGHTYLFGGVYQVCVTIAQNGAVVCSSCQWITVGNNSTTCVIYSWDSIPPYSKNFICQNSFPGSTINWVFGDGSIGTGTYVNHIYQSPGTYTVCVIERDTMNNPLCNSCINVLVGNGPVVCQASFLSASLGLTAYFIDLSVSPLNATTYYWDFGDGTHSSTRFPQHTYSAPTSDTVCLTITSGNCTNLFCSPITVDTAINPGIGCQALFAIVQLATYQVTVVNLSGGVNLGFSWDFGDGSTDTLPYPSHYYATTGLYNLCLTVTDGNGCTSTYCDTIHVDSLGYIYRGMAGFILNVSSPMQITAGVNEIVPLNSFKAFPNPVSNDLHVTSPIEKISAYRILSIQGAEISSGNLAGTENIISMQKFSPGSYLIEITFSDGSRNYQTIIKN